MTSRILCCKRPVCRLTALVALVLSPTLEGAQEVAKDTMKAPVFEEAVAADTAITDAGKSVLALKKRLGVGVAVGASYLIPMDDECRAVMHNYGTYVFDAFADLKTSPADKNPYDAAFGYPTLRVGVLVADYSHIRLWRAEPRLDYVSRMGVATALYGGFLRDVYRSRRWRVGYKFGNGLGIASRFYRKTDNADNEIIGSRWNVFLNIGLYAKYLITPHVEATLGADYMHFSNSALDRPNKGANNVGLTAGLTYYPEAQTNAPRVGRSREKYAEKRFYVEASAGWLGKTLQDDWVFHYWMDGAEDAKYRTSHFTIHHGVTALVAPMYRYSRRYAWGWASTIAMRPTPRDWRISTPCADRRSISIRATSSD